MDNLLDYFETEALPRPKLHERCLRTLTVVGSCWNLLGAGMMMFILGSTTPFAERLRVFAICSLMIGAGIYSVVLPLHFTLKGEGQAK